MSHPPGRHFLQIPGPTNTPLPVLAAIAKPTIDHRGPEFASLGREVLAGIKADIYEDFGALDVHTVAAGATNDHIDAAYQPLDEEADEFERHIREGIMDLLELHGIVDTPVFTRNRISNVKEQVETVTLEAPYLDEETILRKLPNITPDERAKILEKRDAEDRARFGMADAE